MWGHHLPVVDASTNCNMFSDCLKRIQAYRDKNPDHSLITLWVDMKNNGRKNIGNNATRNLMVSFLR